MKNNLIKALKAAGYGDYKAGTKDTINFTTLLADMVEYDNFSYDVETVISIIERLMKSAGIGKKVDERQEEELKKELQKAEDLKKGLMDARAKEDELKVDLALQNKDRRKIGAEQARGDLPEE